MKNHALIFSSRAYPHERSAGAHRIATVLRDNNWDVEVIDFAAHIDQDILVEIAKSRITSNTQFFGFSVFFNYWSEQLNYLIKWVKQTHPGIKTVIGGQNVAFTPVDNIDYWVDGFGELAMLELAKSFVGNTPSGLKFDFNFLGKKKLIKAVTSYPAYPLESYKIILEDRDFVKPYEWLTTEFSRGCKFKCKFCNFPVLGVKGDYSRTQEDFEFEMRYNYDNWGVKNYFVADETFNDSTEKIIKFADVVEKLDFKPFFSGFMRGDLIVTRPQDWEHLVRLNFGGQYYGIESFNRDSARVVGKGMAPDKLKQGMLEAKNYFNQHMIYRGTMSFIIGLPFETEASIYDTRAWLKKNWSDQATVIFPLNIEDPDKDLSKHTNVSEFSKNLQKYGIRRMSATDRGEFINTQYAFNWRDGNYAPEFYMWEHDTMNILQAQELSTILQNDSTGFRLDNWQLNIPSIISKKDFSTIINVKEIQKKTLPIKAKAAPYVQKFVQEYTVAKLNYRPGNI